jgi:hypothetical protein
MEKYEKIKALKKGISKIALANIERDQISINEDLLDSLKTSPTSIPMAILDDLCVSLGINLLEMADILDVDIETKAIKALESLKLSSKKADQKELQVKLQALKDENKELIISLVEECRKEEDDYRDIDEEVVNYFIIVSKDVVDEKQLKGLLEKETEWEREYNDDYGKDRIKKLRKIKKNKFEFSKEATDDNGEFTYTYSLVESKVITSERLAELIKPSFLFHLYTPQLYSISDDSYRKLFFNASRIGKQVIPIINGIGRDELNHLFMWLEKELKI